MNKNIVLHNKFKVYRCPRTNAKIFKDLVENQIIEISVELDKDKDMKRSSRMPIYIDGQKTYISALEEAKENGLKLVEVKPCKYSIQNEGLNITNNDVDNNENIKEQLNRVKSELWLYKYEYEDLLRYLKGLRTWAIKDGLLDYASDIKAELESRKAGKKKYAQK